jgi:uncharacterized protein (TIGR03086 family)
MSDPDLLKNVLAKDTALIDGVRDDQWSLPTPCTEYDVRTLVNHLVGWVQVFAAGVNDRTHEGDPAAYTSDDPSAEFATAAKDLAAGWREGPADRAVKVSTMELPHEMAFAMTLMEYVTHGCDLAIATGQDVPFGEDELETTYAAAKATLPPEYRGEGKAFGDEIPIAGNAPVLDRLLAFMGRPPRG